MYVEAVPSRNSRPQILLREGRREGAKVRKRTLANLTDRPAEKVDALRRVLKGWRLAGPEAALSIERSVPHGHVGLLPAVVRRLGLNRLIAPKRSPERDRVVAMIVERPVHPASKPATTRLWHTATLAGEPDPGDADEDAPYRAMDRLLARRGCIGRRLARRHLREGEPVFADAGGSCCEGRTCPLMRFGCNRDGKRGRPQVVHTVLTAPGGCPVGGPGLSGQHQRLQLPSADQVLKLREQFGLERVVPVGDRGLPAQVRIEHLKRPPRVGPGKRVARTAGAFPGRGRGLAVVAVRRAEPGRVRRSGVPRRMSGGVLQSAAGPRNAPASAGSCSRPPRRHSNASRARLHGAPARRSMRRGSGGRWAGSSTGTGWPGTSGGRCTGGACSIRGTTRGSKPRRAPTGRTCSAPASLRSGSRPRTRSRTCKGLADMERRFRTLKGRDIRVRPIRHRDERRVRADPFLCLLAGYLERHLRRARAPLPFDDGIPAEARRTRDPIAPAQPTERARHGKTRRRTDDGTPLHGFDTLIAELATRCRNTCRIPDDPAAPPLSLLTEPTPTQHRAANLIETFPVLGIPES